MKLKDLIHKLKFYIAEPSCRVGFVLNEINKISDLPYNLDIKWIDNPNDGWYADPFILEVNEDSIEILVEHFLYKTQKGVIDRLTIRKSDYTIISAKTILEVESHLSFPNILRLESGIYVYPENCHSGTLSIYRYDLPSDKLCAYGVLVNEPLIDSCIEYIAGSYYLFATALMETTIESDRSIRIFKSNSPLGPYKHIQTIEIGRPLGRGAGSFIFEDTLIVRPSQNGDGGYGLEVIFSEVKLKDGLFEFNELKRIGPNKFSHWSGLHTFNRYKGICIVDGIEYRRGFVVSMFMKLYNFIFPKH